MIRRDCVKIGGAESTRTITASLRDFGTFYARDITETKLEATDVRVERAGGQEHGERGPIP